MSGLGFAREHRLRKRDDFKACYERGRRYFTRHFIVFVRRREENDAWRLGLAVSGKVGGAVQRNRVKRLVREAIRINQALVPDGLDIVVVAKRGLEVKRLTLGLVEEDLLPLLERIEKDFAHGEHTLPERSH